jgi:hypothetical protein
MRAFTTFLRTSFFLLIVCLGILAQAQTAPPSHAHRYPDAVVARLGVGEGQPELWLWQVSPGCYHGSCEIEMSGWFEIKHYFEFTVVFSMDDPTVGLRFQHEFRSIDEQDSLPDSDFWSTLVFDWDLGVFPQREDFAAYFDDPVVVAQPTAEQPPLPEGSGTDNVTQPGIPKSAPPPAPAPPRPPTPASPGPGTSGPAAPSASSAGYDDQGYDADGYDRQGVDRQGFNRDGVYQGFYDYEGFDSDGYNRDGYDRIGYDRNGRDREGYDYEGFDAAGVSRFGGNLYWVNQTYTLPNAEVAPAWDERGFDASGLHGNGSLFDDYGYDLQGYDREGFDIQGFNRAGEYRDAPVPEVAAPWYDARGFDIAGLSVNGSYYDDLGYDFFGYDLLGYDIEGYDRGGFDDSGWNRLGIDIEGYGRDGRNARGFNRYGIHRNTTLYDEQGFDMQGYNRSGEYFAGHDFNQPTDKAAESKGVITGQGSGQPSGLTAQQQALAELLVAEGFPSGPQVLSDQDIAKLVAQYGSVDKITPAEWEALGKDCLVTSLTLLWYDLENRLGLVQLGLSDEDPDLLRTKQVQIEEYLLGGSAGSFALQASGQIRLQKKTASPEQGFVGKTVEVAKPEPVERDTWKSAAWAFSEALVVGVAVGALIIVAAPVVIAAGTAILASAGVSAASLTMVGGAIEGGLITYAAYDVGKTAVEVKEDLDAGRLDAAASKIGGMTGTIIGGVGASKVLGKGVTRAAGEVVGEGKVVLTTTEAGHGGLKLLSPATNVGAKIESQMIARGWTREMLEEAIRNPSRMVTTRDTRFMPEGGQIDEPALAYYHKDGGYVVRNERTGDVVQVSNRNDEQWIAPWDSK